MNKKLTEVNEIKSLIEILNKARDSYYNENKESMTNKEYDNLYDRLTKLERENNIFMTNSPTQSVGYEIKSKLQKVKHKTPLLSLAKTKQVSDLYDFLHKDISNNGCLFMYKLDGLTTSITYIDGKLTQACTRGNGQIGEDITHNVKQYTNVPLTIPYKDKLVVVGESIITYNSFNEINKVEGTKYKNPRNLASGTVRQLDSKICKNRQVTFKLFDILEGLSNYNSKVETFNILSTFGFDICKFYLIGASDHNLKDILEDTLKTEKDIPIDGMVITYNNKAFCKSLGKTAHHFKSGLAFKWKDDSIETTLRDIIVDIGKSGQVSYVAKFDPVEIDGTTVEKASLHNYSNIKKLKLGIGDKIGVIKANMIIPQIVENYTKSNTYKEITHCPICGDTLEYIGEHQFCSNYYCENRVVGRLTHFCSRNAMNIEGLSEESIKSIRQIKYSNDVSVLENFDDIYDLTLNKDSLYDIPRFGKKKVDNMCKAIEKSKNMPLSNVLYALSIPQVGKTASKLLAEHYKSMINIIDNPLDDKTIKGLIGESTGQSFIDGMNSNGTLTIIKHLIELGLTMEENTDKGTKLDSKTFVITGSTKIYKNRKEIQSIIENLGGKVTGSVSKNTDYLINNDVESSSSKNKKAKSLNVPIINEEQFQKLI